MLARAAKSEVLVKICVWLAAVLYVGLLGVLAGGMAHLADMDERGRKASVSSALGFCMKKFAPLFSGTVLFAIVASLVFLAANRIPLFLDRQGNAGSFLAALLSLPQFAVNVAVLVTLVVWVLVPIAIAAENASAGQAVGRLCTCLFRDTGRLLVQFAISIALAIMMLQVLAALLLAPMLATFGISGFRSMVALFSFDLFGFSSPVPFLLRAIFVGLIAVDVMAYFAAYWVGSFTGYYRDALRRGFRG
jgi:hypothetical protein